MGDRREEILDAALDAFLEKGWMGTTIADIRERSGATTGSIYHAFGGKEDIGETLYLKAIEGWQKATIDLKPDFNMAQQAIESSVRGLFEWAIQNPRLFQFMDQMRFLDPRIRQQMKRAPVTANTEQEAERLFQTWVEKGLVRSIKWPLARSLILGPAYEYLRSTIGNDKPRDRENAREELVKAAWDSVRLSKPSRRKS